jgi:N-methylhydantoinase A
MLRIGVDTGGTFTDLVWMQAGRRRTHKVPSTPDDPSRAVLEGLATVLGEAATEALAVVHGSTVATNALLEGKVARVALLTNAGFEDLLAIGRQDRPDLYDPSVSPPEPLVPADLRLGVPGRLGPGGEEWQALDLDAVGAAVARAGAAGVTRFAVCLLHSYADPRHEEAVAAVVAGAGGQATLSSRILPEYREYERASTTVVNAVLAPVMTGYLGSLEADLPAAGRLSVFRSNGGILSASAAGEEAVQTLLSGPAAGVLGASSWGRRCGLPRLITFDMGGTSTDVALVDGRPGLTTETTVGGHPVRLPMIDIHTVGAGGGSLARCDAGGALVVGPDSAGADPGPACYGRGERATVTDAQLALGRLQAGHFLGGRMMLDGGRARDALAALGEPLGLSPREAARGVVRVANAGMERAIRVVSLARGHDPRDFALFCFGGAGGLHAADLAAALGIGEVIVPPGAGTFSAWGMMVADVVRDASRAVLRPLEAVPPEERAALAAPLAERLLAEMASEGFTAGEVRLERSLDLRYRGQSFELNVPEGADPAPAFAALHRRRYDHDRPGVPVELVALRVRAVGPVPDPVVAEEGETGGEAPSPADTVEVDFGQGPVPAALHLRSGLAPGHALGGPAVVAASGSTTAVPPGWTLRVDGWRNLRLAPDGRAA